VDLELMIKDCFYFPTHAPACQTEQRVFLTMTQQERHEASSRET
jgi:hypothetical protein